MPPDAAAFEQTVRQNQERVSQQILQTQQQIEQRHPEMMQRHELPGMGLPQIGIVSLWPFLACGGLALACGFRAFA
jgi:hypothetical protein